VITMPAPFKGTRTDLSSTRRRENNAPRAATNIRATEV
jgi:hypothetical protein